MRQRAAAMAFAGAIATLSPLQTTPHFDLPRDTYLLDDVVPIVLTGVAPHARVTIAARGDAMGSSALFTADEAGRVDVTTTAPIQGGYSSVDAMGLFWSAKANGPNATSDDAARLGGGVTWTISAEVDGRTIARADVKRYAVDPAVRVTPVRERGLVGTFYQPAGGGAHPAVIVLTGSGGGVPPPAGAAGGLASRGYCVFALAYFRAEGLPPTLSNIRLEYFGTALEWLAAQPSVDRDRLGVLGGSRGAELALLLAVIYPQIRAVVAYMPSNVVWRGCCDRFSQVAWTIHGQPLASARAGDGASQLRAQIPVEEIKGPILLVSGKDDGVWDSSGMAKKIVERLQAKHFPYPVEHESYERAGHAITRPYTSTMNLDSMRHPLTGNIIHLGGTPAGTAHAREDAWRHVLEFLAKSLDAR